MQSALPAKQYAPFAQAHSCWPEAQRNAFGSQVPPTSPKGNPLSPGRQTNPVSQVHGLVVFPPQRPPGPETQPASGASRTHLQSTGSHRAADGQGVGRQPASAIPPLPPAPAADPPLPAVMEDPPEPVAPVPPDPPTAAPPDPVTVMPPAPGDPELLPPAPAPPSRSPTDTTPPLHEIAAAPTRIPHKVALFPFLIE
jgi:hypothetical protein